MSKFKVGDLVTLLPDKELREVITKYWDKENEIFIEDYSGTVKKHNKGKIWKVTRIIGITQNISNRDLVLIKLQSTEDVKISKEEYEYLFTLAHNKKYSLAKFNKMLEDL